jgi:hypothetical protein
MARADQTPLHEELLPVYDVCDQLALVTRADPETAWRALGELDLIELGRRRPLIGALSAIRALPAIAAAVLHGGRPQSPPKRLRLAELSDAPAGEGGWTLLGERPGRELALGLVGRFWRPVIEFAEVSAEGFREFDRPGYAKTVYSFEVRPLAEGGSLLVGTMRTATTDERARRSFRRYWALGVGSGAHVMVNAMLERVREIAEAGGAEPPTRS